MTINMAAMDRRAKALLLAFTANYAVATLKWLLFPQDGSWQFWIVDLASHVFFPLLLLLFLAKNFSLSPRLYGLSLFPRDSRILNIWLAVFVYTVLLSAAYFAGYIIGWLTETAIHGDLGSNAQYHLLVPKNGILRLVVILYFALSASVFEEIFFRGLFQLLADVFTPNASRALVVVGSAILFSMTHWAGGLPALAAGLLFGLAAAWLFSYQRDLRPLIAAHSLLNIIIGLQ
jgi:membrane protease YdiL (CAAX protease family)